MTEGAIVCMYWKVHLLKNYGRMDGCSFAVWCSTTTEIVLGFPFLSYFGMVLFFFILLPHLFQHHLPMLIWTFKVSKCRIEFPPLKSWGSCIHFIKIFKWIAIWMLLSTPLLALLASASCSSEIISAVYEFLFLELSLFESWDHPIAGLGEGAANLVQWFSYLNWLVLRNWKYLSNCVIFGPDHLSQKL